MDWGDSNHHKIITAIGSEVPHFITWSHELLESNMKPLHGSQQQEVIFLMHFA